MYKVQNQQDYKNKPTARNRQHCQLQQQQLQQKNRAKHASEVDAVYSIYMSSSKKNNYIK